LRRLRRWGPGQHRFRFPDRQLPDARHRAVGLPARPLPSLARLAPFPRARARPRLLEADPPERRSSAAARRKPAPSRSARLRSLISASRRAFYTPARDRVTTRFAERIPLRRWGHALRLGSLLPGLRPIPIPSRRERAARAVMILSAYAQPSLSRAPPDEQVFAGAVRLA